MTKHLADKRTPSNGGRTKNFVTLERQSGDEGSHPASRNLVQRAVNRSDATRVREFVRIERGQTA